MTEIDMLTWVMVERMKIHRATRQGSGSSRKEDVIVNTQVSWRWEVKYPVTKIFSDWEGSHKNR